MFYEDPTLTEEEYEHRFVYDKKEKKFYKLYSALMKCHAIIINGHMYEYELHDIEGMKPTKPILEISFLDDVHAFDIESLMEADIHNHSLVLKNTKGDPVELIPSQLRSMITDGTISFGR